MIIQIRLWYKYEKFISVGPEWVCLSRWGQPFHMASPQRLTGWWDVLSYEVHVSFFGQFSIWLSVKSDYLLKITFRCKPFVRCVEPMFPDLYLLFLCFLSWLWREFLMWSYKMFLKCYISNLISQIPIIQMGKNQILPICSIGMLWPLTNGKCFMG